MLNIFIYPQSNYLLIFVLLFTFSFVLIFQAMFIRYLPFFSKKSSNSSVFFTKVKTAILFGMAFFVLMQLPKTFLRSDSGEVCDIDEEMKFYTAFSSHCAISHGFDNILIMEVLIFHFKKNNFFPFLHILKFFF